ncbi:MAG TPA: hypothetical protein VGN47_14395 [Blastococcus sp.]|jgi:hypothetical protein|nr:hypothetical protein [Blastococcus sp.]
MSSISVQLDVVAALAAELAALASDLDEDSRLCHSSAATLATALGGDEGWTAGSAGGLWAALTGLVAARTRAIAGTLAAAVDAYRAADEAMAHRIGAGRLLAVTE